VAGFYQKEEEWREGGRAEDDLEEEDYIVPTLHVGARSPFSVGREGGREGERERRKLCAYVRHSHPPSFPASPQVTEIYLEDLRGFCPFLQNDLSLSTFVDTLVRRGGGAFGAKPALDEKMMTICVKMLASLVAPGEVALVFVAGTSRPLSLPLFLYLRTFKLTTIPPSLPPSFPPLPLGMADIEDLHTLFSDLLPAHQSARLDIVPFHSLISAEETVRYAPPSSLRPSLAILLVSSKMTDTHASCFLTFSSLPPSLPPFLPPCLFLRTRCSRSRLTDLRLS